MANTKITDLTSGTAAGTDEIPINKAGADRKTTVASIGLIVANPPTSDGDALGTTSLMWSDLFLASGAVINFNNGDVTITHSANTLTFAAATTGYVFSNGPVNAPAYKTPDAGELTISSGAVTVTAGNHTVDTESDDATDDLDTINGGADGMQLFLRAAHTDRTIEITEAGNILGTKTLDSTSLVAHLIYDAELTSWIVVNP